MRNVQIMASLGAFRQERRIFHVIANNLSNAQTAGFKRNSAFFHSLLSENMGYLESIPVDGVKTVFLQGNLERTGNDLHMAIEGDGFFKVKSSEGIRYTRAGNFKLNKDKVLVNADGFPVMGKQGEITIQGQTVSVEKDGTIRVDGAEIGQIGLVNFSDLSLLQKEGQTLFRPEVDLKELNVPESMVHQGYLESSNVNPIEEMVGLIDSFRSYETCLKVIQSHDEMDGKAVNELGKI